MNNNLELLMIRIRIINLKKKGKKRGYSYLKWRIVSPGRNDDPAACGSRPRTS